MGTAVYHLINFHSDHRLTRHAWERMSARGISPDAVRRVIDHGRVAHVRGATIYAVGRKEVERYQKDDINLSDVEGVQVVCSNSGTVLTVYRNRDLRGLRPRSRRPRQRS